MRILFCFHPVVAGANLVPALPNIEERWHALGRLFLVARGWVPRRRLAGATAVQCHSRERGGMAAAASGVQLNAHKSAPLPCSFTLLVPPLCFLLHPRHFLALQALSTANAMFRVRADCGCCFLQLAHARAEMER